MEITICIALKITDMYLFQTYSLLNQYIFILFLIVYEGQFTQMHAPPPPPEKRIFFVIVYV